MMDEKTRAEFRAIADRAFERIYESFLRQLFAKSPRGPRNVQQFEDGSVLIDGPFDLRECLRKSL